MRPITITLPGILSRRPAAFGIGVALVLAVGAFAAFGPMSRVPASSATREPTPPVGAVPTATATPPPSAAPTRSGPLPTRPPAPTARATPRFTAPAKGALIWEARLDATGGDFTVSGGGPQPNLPTVRTPAGAVEVAITRPSTSGALVPLGLALPDQDRYVAELDLALEPADMTVMWQLRRPSSFALGVGLVVLPTGRVGAYRFQPDFQPLAPEAQITGLDSGRTVTIAVVATHPRYEVFIDGTRALEFTSDISGISIPMFGVEGNAGVLRITRLQYFSAP